jgi:opacity protein-like surface antigen
MNRLKLVAIGTALALQAVAPMTALAADITPYVDPAPAPLASGGWYLRGAIGMSNQKLGHIDYQYFDSSDSWLDKGHFSSAPTFSVGAGYQFNDWFRTDVTGQYRGAASFDALQSVTSGGDTYTDAYTGKKHEWLFLANGYVDLGSYHGVIPYLGAGIGASRNTITDFNDTNTVLGGGGYAGSESTWNLAWALHAGVGFKVTENLIFDLGYSYVDLGNAKTDTAYNYDPAFSRPNDGFKFKHLTSHDINFGLRYMFN